MSGGDGLKSLLAELSLFAEPVVGSVGNPLLREHLFDALGWQLSGLTGFSPQQFDAWASEVQSAVQQLQQVLEAGLPSSLSDVEKWLPLAKHVSKLVATPPPALKAALPPEANPEVLAPLMAEDLLGFLTTKYLRRRAPAAYQAAILLGLIIPVEEAQPSAPIPATGAPIRLARRRSQLRLGELSALVSDPVGRLKGRYLPNGLHTAAQADVAAAALFPKLGALLEACGFLHAYGMKPGVGPDQGAIGTALAASMLKVWWPVPLGAQGARLGASLALSSNDRGGLGLVVVPAAAVVFEALLQNWLLKVNAAGVPPAFSIGAAGFQRVEGSGGVSVSSTLERIPDGEGKPIAWTLGAANGTRLEVGRLELSAMASLGAGSDDYGLMFKALESAFVVAPDAKGDGFLQQVLPPEGLRLSFGFGIGWSKRYGLRFEGSAGLDANLPIGKDILGVLRLDSLHLGLRAEAGGLRTEASATVGVKLGPVTVTVERFGVEANLTFPPGGGNVGPAELALGFKPPSGAAVAIDAGVVVGGGYLRFDREKEQYAGAVQLEIAKRLSLSAFGLLTTRMPDGKKGFSLLVLMAAEFSPPVQLGYGFTLNGVGGLVGVNRTVSVDALRAGLRAGTLGSVLFPKDPIRNAPQIVSDLQAFFPPAQGRFVFGPMAKLGWGTPTLVTLELGLLLELPAPVRLFLLSRLRVVLPDERTALVRLNLDAMGVIDFATGDVALDAVLYDSQIAQFTVTGDMALRANFGDRPNFVLAIGGFNPRFQAPAGFPQLERVAISLAKGNNPRLRMEAYLALTTNTLQFGARVDLFAEAGPFSLSGNLGFDALVQYRPFGFIVDLSAGVALKFKGKSVMSVGLEMTLSGPSPWHAVGKARFKVLFISGSISFDVRFGKKTSPPLPAPVDVKPLLLAALRDKGNWVTQLPASEAPLVSLRAMAPTDDVLVHPLADLQVTQKVVPLGLEISRYGNTRPSGTRLFTLGVVGADGLLRTRPEQGVQPVSDAFAPGQFREMSDDERLAAPAFEQFQSGIRFAERGFACGTAVVEPDIRYETSRMSVAPTSPTTLAAPTTSASRVAPSEAEMMATSESDMRVASEVDTMATSESGATARSAPVPPTSPGKPMPAAPVPPTPKPLRQQVKPTPLSATFLQQVASVGAAGLSSKAVDAERSRPPEAARRGFGLKPPSYGAVGTAGTPSIPPAGPPGAVPAPGSQTFAAASEARKRRLLEHPEERKNLRVVVTGAVGGTLKGGSR